MPREPVPKTLPPRFRGGPCGLQRCPKERRHPEQCWPQVLCCAAWNVPTRSETTTPVVTSLGLGHTGRVGQMDLCPERHVPPRGRLWPRLHEGRRPSVHAAPCGRGLRPLPAQAWLLLSAPALWGGICSGPPKAQQQGALLISVASPRHSLPSRQKPAQSFQPPSQAISSQLSSGQAGDIPGVSEASVAEEGQPAPGSHGAVPWKESGPCALCTLGSGPGVGAPRTQRTAPHCAGSPGPQMTLSEPLAGPPRARLQALCLAAGSALTLPGATPRPW